ncbi:hypothetical protein ACLOJK_022043 [Asimina triloba]
MASSSMAKNKVAMAIQNFHRMASLVFPLIRSSQFVHHIEEDEPATVIEEEEMEKENPE